MVKEIAIMEQRYRAMLAFLADVRGVGEVVAQFGVSRQPVHASICRWKYYVLFGRRYCTNERGRNRPHDKCQASTLQLVSFQMKNRGQIVLAKKMTRVVFRHG